MAGQAATRTGGLVEAGAVVRMSKYTFLLHRRDTFMSLLAQRDAIRNQSGFDIAATTFWPRLNLDITWVATPSGSTASCAHPLAALLNGLLARTTDADADPFSLKPADLTASLPRGYGRTPFVATGQTGFAQQTRTSRSTARGPASRRVANDWENTSPASKAALTRLTTASD